MVEPIADDAPKGTPERSPRFPFVPLKEALERARAIHKKEGRNAASPHVIMEHVGYGPKSGTGRQVVAALRSFGLLEPAGEKLKLSDTALRIIIDERETSPDRDALTRKAALAPPIHQKLWDRYKLELPSDSELKYTLRTDYNFSGSAVDAFILNYKATLAFAKLGDDAKIAQPAGADAKAKAPFAVGDLVDWESQGVLQNAEPLRITGLSGDGSYALIEGHKTGLPVSQLTRVQPAEGKTMDTTASALQPPHVPPAPLSQPPPLGALGGVKQEVTSLAEGQAVLRWPESLSPESYEDFKDWLELVLRKVARSAGVKTDKAGG